MTQTVNGAGNGDWLSAADPDAEGLLALARKGNDEAFGQLLELYRGQLGLVARLQIARRLQGEVDPSDAVQDTFLQAHRAFTQFHGTTEAKLLGWQRRILASKLADLVRRYYVTQRRVVGLDVGSPKASARAVGRTLQRHFHHLA